MKEDKIGQADDPWFDGIYDPLGNKLYRFHPPLMEVVRDPYIPLIPLIEIKERRFDLIERTKNLARSELEKSILFDETWMADDPLAFSLKSPVAFSGVNKNGDLFNW